MKQTRKQCGVTMTERAGVNQTPGPIAINCCTQTIHSLHVDSNLNKN